MLSSPDNASSEKHRLEEKQRASRKNRSKTQAGWTPAWFKEGRNPHCGEMDWLFTEDYWNRDFAKCPDIFWWPSFGNGRSSSNETLEQVSSSSHLCRVVCFLALMLGLLIETWQSIEVSKIRSPELSDAHFKDKQILLAQWHTYSRP